MNQLLTKRTLSLGRINLFLKYKIRLKNALASNIERKFGLIYDLVKWGFLSYLSTPPPVLLPL